MTPLDYDFLRKLLKDRSGLVLSGDKEYLVESRLLPIARKQGLSNLNELVGKLRAPLAVTVIAGLLLSTLLTLLVIPCAYNIVYGGSRAAGART